MYPPVGPILLQLGSLTIRWYGVLMAIAIAVGVTVAARYIERFHYSRDTIYNMLIWVLVPAIIGARLYFVFIQKPWTADGTGYYLHHPDKILAVWDGGIHIFGALIVGFIAVYLYIRHYRLPLALYLDAIAFALPLAQSIGRWGNFINQELYGPPTKLPWGLRIDDANRIPPFDNLALYPESTRFQPLFLYESLWNFAGFWALFVITRRYADKLKRGDVFLMYLLIYPSIRFILEFFRTDSWFVPGLHINLVHVLCLAAIIGASLALYLRHRPAPAQPDFFVIVGQRGAAVAAQIGNALPFLQKLALPAPLSPAPSAPATAGDDQEPSPSSVGVTPKLRAADATAAPPTARVATPRTRARRSISR